MRATRGDDVYRECQTTIDLENRVAALCGKEAGAFGQSGTMTNREQCIRNGGTSADDENSQLGHICINPLIRSLLIIEHTSTRWKVSISNIQSSVSARYANDQPVESQCSLKPQPTKSCHPTAIT
jgi:hypothetical protein